MNSLTVLKPGKSKEQLLRCLENLKDKFKAEMEGNNINLVKTADGYDINAEKKILFLNFRVNAKIVAEAGAFNLSWDTNAPESKVIEAMDKVKDILEKC